MNAADIMTTTVVTIAPTDTVKHAAELMAKHHVSALPVVDQKGKLVGIVSEGDLLHREETHTDTKARSWWLDLVTGYETRAEEYVKAFATHVRDVMSEKVVTVNEKASLAEVASLLESKHIKRVPVMRGAKIVGILSRANLVQALASVHELVVPAGKPDDAAIRERVLAELEKHHWLAAGTTNVVVHNGLVHLWGEVFSVPERQAARVAVERIPGVAAVKDHMTYYVPTPVLM